MKWLLVVPMVAVWTLNFLLACSLSRHEESRVMHMRADGGNGCTCECMYDKTRDSDLTDVTIPSR